MEARNYYRGVKLGATRDYLKSFSHRFLFPLYLLLLKACKNVEDNYLRHKGISVDPQHVYKTSPFYQSLTFHIELVQMTFPQTTC